MTMQRYESRCVILVGKRVLANVCVTVVAAFSSILGGGFNFCVGVQQMIITRFGADFLSYVSCFVLPASSSDLIDTV